MAKRKTPSAGAAPGAAHPRSIFTAEDIGMIFSLRKDGWTYPEIAERMTEVLVATGARAKSEPPIAKQVIGKIIRGETYAEE